MTLGELQALASALAADYGAGAEVVLSIAGGGPFAIGLARAEAGAYVRRPSGLYDGTHATAGPAGGKRRRPARVQVCIKLLGEGE